MRRIVAQQSVCTLLLVELGAATNGRTAAQLSKFVAKGSVERLLMAVVHACVLQSRRLELCGLCLAVLASVSYKPLANCSARLNLSPFALSAERLLRVRLRR